MEINKNTFGQVFFAISILMLIYMLINPLTQTITNINEYFTLTLVNFPVSHIINVSTGFINPPLYFLILKSIEAIFHPQNIYLFKIFSVIPFAILLLVSTFKIRKDYGWFTSGLFCLALMTMSGFFTSSMLLRPYSWTVLFCVLAFICFGEIITSPDLRSFILFPVFCLLASYTHYYGFIISVVLCVILIYHVFVHNSQNVRYLAISVAAFFVLYIPWISTLIKILYAIPAKELITADSIIQGLAHFAYSGDSIFSIITLVIFFAVFALYMINSDDNRQIVFYGIITYFATIAVVLLVSIVFKSILVSNALVGASAILWLSIAIMASKIRNKRHFLISLALIVLVLVSGIGSMLAVNSHDLEAGLMQNDITEKLEQENSVVIITDPGIAMYLLDFSDAMNIYCVDSDFIYGESGNALHELFNFTSIDKNTVKDFAANNTDKDIYLVGWGENDLGLKAEPVSNNGMVITKVDTQSLLGDEYLE